MTNSEVTIMQASDGTGRSPLTEALTLLGSIEGAKLTCNTFSNSLINNNLYFTKTYTLGEFLVEDVFKIDQASAVKDNSSLKSHHMSSFDGGKITSPNGTVKEYNCDQFIDYIRDLNSITQILNLQGK